jgi:hypothetical protein
VGDAVLLIVAMLLPTALGVMALAAARVVRWWTEWRLRPAPAAPIEQLCATVRRLHAQLESLENQPAAAPGKGLRMRALRTAYLDALCTACGRLDVPAPAGHPIRQAEIYRVVEADLRRRGLDVRPAVP